MARRLRIATRRSPLARWQAERVATLIGGAELVLIETEGDIRGDVPLAEIGGQGVFTKEVQVAVLDGRADIAVHSAKDLPASLRLQPEGLVLASIPERADARDVLVGSTLSGLAGGAVVATGSPRRQAQLAHVRPDLRFVDLRGNIDTRLAKVPPGGAIVMAAAALDRLGRQDVVSEVLDPSVMVPAVAQGALAAECRDDDDETLNRLVAVEDSAARLAVDAERAFLAELGGGCDLPVGAYAVVLDHRGLRLTGLLATEDEDGGVILHRDSQQGDASDPVGLGRGVARAVLRAAELA